jgi:hypothetical protein
MFILWKGASKMAELKGLPSAPASPDPRANIHSAALTQRNRSCSQPRGAVRTRLTSIPPYSALGRGRLWCKVGAWFVPLAVPRREGSP